MSPNTLPEYRKLRDELQALDILLILSSDTMNGQANERLIAVCLDISALGGSRDSIRTALHRLEERRLIRTETVKPLGESLVVASISELGQRVAEGKEACEGVARPSRD